MRTYRLSWRVLCPGMSHTVVSMQWGGIKNGELLTLIERERFDVFLTGDKKHGQTAEPGRPSVRRADYVRYQLAGRQAAHSENLRRARRGAAPYRQDD